MRMKIGLLLCMMLGLWVNVCLGQEDPILGKAGDYVIRQSDLERMIRYSPPDKQKAIADNPEQRMAIVRFMLEVKVISDWARKEGFDKKPEVKEQMNYVLNNYLAQEYLIRVAAMEPNVTEEELRKFYTDHEKNFMEPEQARVRHILIRLPQGASEEDTKKARSKAEGLLQRIKKGEDFSKMAEQYSDDPGSKQNGGDIGFFSRGQVVKPFEDAVFSLKPGQTSEVVETQFGYHLIKVEEFKPEGVKPFEEVKELIRPRLQEEEKRSRGEEFIKRVSREAGLEIYSEKIAGEGKKE